MLRVSVTLKNWLCPRLNREVGLRIETLEHLDTRVVRARKFACDMVYLCDLPPARGNNRPFDYTTCVCPEAHPQ